MGINWVEEIMGTDVTDFKRKYKTANTGEFPTAFNFSLNKEGDLRYGENPNQTAAAYQLGTSELSSLINIRVVKSGKGGISATNYMDVTRALDILKFFVPPSVAVMKHVNPSGFATQYKKNKLIKNTELVNTYLAARDADARSAFGGIVVTNCSIDKATADAITSTYMEGVAAPEYEEGVMDVFGKKSDLRAIQFSNLDKIPKFIGDNTEGLYDLKSLPTGRLILQQPYLSSIRSAEDLIIDPLVRKKNEFGQEVSYGVINRPTSDELADLLTAWYVNIGVRSNGIVIVKNGITLAVGTGQQERVGAVEQAIVKAYQKALDREKIKYDSLQGVCGKEKLSYNPLQGAVMSSDAFFPFRDSVDTAARVGITAIIQPGGSQRDYEVIQAANEHKMGMAFTLERCFGHF